MEWSSSAIHSHYDEYYYHYHTHCKSYHTSNLISSNRISLTHDGRAPPEGNTLIVTLLQPLIAHSALRVLCCT